jgi:hypothetical protein
VSFSWVFPLLKKNNIKRPFVNVKGGWARFFLGDWLQTGFSKKTTGN